MVMKKIYLSFLVLLLIFEAEAQNNVGIGTTSPSPNAILHLENGASDLGLLLPNVDHTTFNPGPGVDPGLMIYDDNDGKVYTWDGNTWVSSTSEWGVNANNIFNLNSGNVGIGTNTPIQKFHVFNSTGFDGILIESADPTGGSLLAFINDNPAVFAQIGLNGSTNGIYPDAFFLTQNGNHPIKFGTNFIDRMIITGTGDIGIGTLSPVARLHIENTVSVSSQRGTLMSYSNNNSTSNAIVAVGSSNGLSTGLIYSRAHLAGYGEGPFGFADYGVWGHAPNGTWGVIASNGIDSMIPNSYVALAGTSFSGLFMNGNVGINTLSPTTSKLVISGANGEEGLDLASTDQYANLRVIRNSLGTIDKDMYIGFQSGIGSELHLYSNNLETMTITSGRVGIGTISPTYALTLGMTGQVFGVENTASFLARNSGGTYETYLWPRWSDNIMYLNYGSGGFHIRNNGSASTMFMTSDNRIGIGTTAPSTQGKVHIAGGALAIDGTSLYGISWVSGNTLQADLFRFGSVNDRLYVTNNGLSNTTGVYLASGAVGWSSTSDRRLKENIVESPYGLNEILQLSPKEYNFITTENKDKRIGFLAQDVYQIIPEIVQKGDDGEYRGEGNAKMSAELGFNPWGINYTELVPVLVKAVQELNAQNEALLKRIEVLESK